MSQPKHALKRPTNTWAVAMSNTEADYVRQVTNMSEEDFLDTLGMFEEDSTSLFYQIMIEEEDKRKRKRWERWERRTMSKRIK